MAENQTYAWPIGEADKQRLNLQCRLCNPYTERFRNLNLPDLTGQIILDIGCGTGILSCYWAKQVGSTGRVIAADLNPEQLKIAKINAQAQGLNNIEFIELDIKNLEKLEISFDLIYCRFLLMHLPNPKALIKNMFNKLKLTGRLFCEECMSYDAFFADPDSTAFQSLKDLILKLPLLYNTDFFIGKRLNTLFREIGFSNIKSEICQPIISLEEDKGYFYLDFDDPVFKQKFVDKKLTMLEEFNKIMDDFKQEALGKPWVSSTAQYMQIVGQKFTD